MPLFAACIGPVVRVPVDQLTAAPTISSRHDDATAMGWRESSGDRVVDKITTGHGSTDTEVGGSYGLARPPQGCRRSANRGT
jgi:hypothetical protein